MAEALKKLAQVNLTNADAAIYTAAALTTTTIIAIYKTNIDTTDRTFRLHQVSGGGTSSVSNALYYDEPVTAKRVHPRIDSGIVIEPGQSLRGLCSSTGTVTVTVFGVESVESA